MGAAEKSKIIVVLGLASLGIHSNGYSLERTLPARGRAESYVCAAISAAISAAIRHPPDLVRQRPQEKVLLSLR